MLSSQTVQDEHVGWWKEINPLNAFCAADTNIPIHSQHARQLLVILVQISKVLTALKQDLRAVLFYLVDKDKHYIWNYQTIWK